MTTNSTIFCTVVQFNTVFREIFIHGTPEFMITQILINLQKF